ncbi:hypothetical protein [Bradyrhizobium vignae]|uniref:Uncharacterized protein n=1 Tax=Bradyrhizobium vignae TaxID=1549949 RepID=A0A2U3PS45_9BRAD|nr:hypothetical protein [Bradyrhizobium vignae]SPP92000.1 conserved protein of unknown function [Bradyrhizobium vignae]
MDEVKGIQAARHRLHEAVGSFRPPPPQPLDIFLYLAMSAMQKAIRRGRTELALQAAATLLEQSPERLWRRLACIAFEDVGLGDLELVTLATAAMAGKRVRALLGGEWAVASYLVCRMAETTKCRAADDLLLVAENHLAFQTERLQLGFSTIRELAQVVSSCEPFPVRALAAWYLLGTDRRPSPQLVRRRGDLAALFAALAAILPPDLVEIAREGHRRSGEVLPIFMALLSPHLQHEPVSVEDDDAPPETMVGPVPGFCLDLYTRPGRAALASLIEGPTRTARWVRSHIPPRQRVTFLGTIIFRLEGGCVQSRLRWRIADHLRRVTDYECNGAHCQDATEILGLAQADLGELNAIRAEVMKGWGHVS